MSFSSERVQIGGGGDGINPGGYASLWPPERRPTAAGKLPPLAKASRDGLILDGAAAAGMQWAKHRDQAEAARVRIYFFNSYADGERRGLHQIGR